MGEPGTGSCVSRQVAVPLGAGGDFWDRHRLDELARFDDTIEFSGYEFAYAFPDDPATSRVTFVHDMNASGQMVVTLSLQGVATMPIGGGPSAGLVEYPCIVTLASDFDGNLRVDSRDLKLLSDAWGTATAKYDLNGNGNVDASDMAWLLSDYSGSDPCDLHRVIPCELVEMEGLAGGMAEEAGGATSPPLTLAAALASLGFADTGAFAVWAAAAEPDELEAMTELLVSLTQP